MPLYTGWLTAILCGKAFLSFGTALQFGLGNCANFVSSNVFITTQAPKYPVGFGTGLNITAFAAIVQVFTMWLFGRHNEIIDKKAAALGPGEELDDQIDYKYVFQAEHAGDTPSIQACRVLLSKRSVRNVSLKSSL